MKKVIAIIFSFALLFVASCSKTEVKPAEASNATIDNEEIGSRKMPNMAAYYDSALFSLNMNQMPINASAALIANNGSINEIYVSNDLNDAQVFIPVIDAIHGDGFNPLWRQVFIVFNVGFTPHQFFSDTEIEAAASSTNPEITLVDTDEVYRCSIVGSH